MPRIRTCVTHASDDRYAYLISVGYDVLMRPAPAPVTAVERVMVADYRAQLRRRITELAAGIETCRATTAMGSSGPRGGGGRDRIRSYEDQITECYTALDGLADLYRPPTPNRRSWMSTL